MNHMETICAQTPETDIVGVVPCLDKEQHVDSEVAADVKQIVEFVGDGADVQQSEHRLSTFRHRMTMNVDA